MDTEIISRAENILSRLRERNLKLSVAESCTGGLLSGYITGIPGASDIFICGFITYSNQSKISLIDVPEILISRYGAVSPEVATAMAEGALIRSGSDVALSITGIAGPGGATSEKPVGLVYIGYAFRNKKPQYQKLTLQGDRDAIRRQSCNEALKSLAEYLPDPS